MGKPDCHQSPAEPRSASHTARAVLLTFLFTFVAARLLVLLITARKVPDLYLYVRGTHIHHLNYGILLLAAVGAWLLFRRPTGREATAASIAYGIGLALTFDEFGMWLHLGGSYWQRASYDAVVAIGGVLGLIAFAPAVRKFRPRHWIAAVLLALVLAAFVYGLILTVYRHPAEPAPAPAEPTNSLPEYQDSAPPRPPP